MRRRRNELNNIHLYEQVAVQKKILGHDYIGSDGWDYSKHTTSENFAHGFFHPIDYTNSVQETYATNPNPTPVQKAVRKVLTPVAETGKAILSTAEKGKDTVVQAVKAPFNFLDDVFGSLKWVIILAIIIAIIYGYKQLKG